MTWRPNFVGSASSPGPLKVDSTSIQAATDGTLSVVGVGINGLPDAGTLSLSDKDVVNRSGTDYSTTQSSRAAMINKTPAGEREMTLGGATATLTASDHNKNIILTGSSGGTLTGDGTMTSGFRCYVENQSLGAATYGSPLSGLLGTTSLPSGAACIVRFANAGLGAMPIGSVSVSPATAYTTTLSAVSGTSGTPVTMSFVPNGLWASGQTIIPTVVTLAGTFATVTNGTLAGGVITPTPGNTNAVSVQFTPSSPAGTSGTLNSTPAAGLTNTTGALNYTIIVVYATSYTISESATTGFVGSAVTLVMSPVGGSWPSAMTIMPAVAGISGTFSPTTTTPTANGTNSVSCTFTPSTAGSATLSVSNTGSLTNPSSLNYTAVAAANAYSMTESASSGNLNGTLTLTFTPVSGAWPSNVVLTPAVSGVTATFTPTTITTVAASTAAVTCTMTPSTAGTAAIAVTSSPTMTNPSNLTYSVSPIPAYPSITTSGVARQLIWDASQLTGSNTSLVTALADQSGNGYNASGGSSATTLVTASQNNLNGVIFSGASLAQALVANASWVDNLRLNHTGLLVFKAPSGFTSGGGVPLWFGNSAADGSYGSNTPGQDQLAVLSYSSSGSPYVQVNRIANGSPAGAVAVQATSVSVLQKLVWRYNSANKTTELWLNSQTKMTGTNSSSSGSQTWNFLALGAPDAVANGATATNAVFTGAFIGTFYELELWSGNFADSDISTIQSYMTSKWGS